MRVSLPQFPHTPPRPGRQNSNVRARSTQEGVGCHAERGLLRRGGEMCLNVPFWGCLAWGCCPLRGPSSSSGPLALGLGSSPRLAALTLSLDPRHCPRNLFSCRVPSCHSLGKEAGGWGVELSLLFYPDDGPHTSYRAGPRCPGSPPLLLPSRHSSPLRKAGGGTERPLGWGGEDASLPWEGSQAPASYPSILHPSRLGWWSSWGL